MKPFIKPNLLNDYHLLSYEELDSTNEEARRLAEGGASHGAVIWAKKQTSGRGRMGRKWESVEGNLYCSLLLSPGCDLATAGQLAFVTAIAALETIAPILPDGGDLRCKWPNDILLEGNKLGGILLESFETADIRPGNNKMVRWVVAGIGINIESHPEKTDFPATHLKEAGVEIISAKIVLSRFIHHFIKTYDLWSNKGFAPIRKAWIENAWKIGETIEVRLPDQTISGIFESIDTSGRLVVVDKKGKKHAITAGDVFF